MLLLEAGNSGVRLSSSARTTRLEASASTATPNNATSPMMFFKFVIFIKILLIFIFLVLNFDWN
jgi:hypothetical protein